MLELWLSHTDWLDNCSKASESPLWVSLTTTERVYSLSFTHHNRASLLSEFHSPQQSESTLWVSLSTTERVYSLSFTRHNRASLLSEFHSPQHSCQLGGERHDQNTCAAVFTWTEQPLSLPGRNRLVGVVVKASASKASIITNIEENIKETYQSGKCQWG